MVAFYRATSGSASRSGEAVPWYDAHRRAPGYLAARGRTANMDKQDDQDQARRQA